MRKDVLMKQIIDNKMSKWNHIVGYDVENILKDLGFTFDSYDKLGYCGFCTKHYVNENGNYGWLSIIDVMPGNVLTFFEYDKDGNEVSIINFDKVIDMVEFVPEGHEKGIVELKGGNYLMDLMYYYNAEDRKKRMIGNQNNDIDSPTATMVIGAVDPLERIKKVKEWARLFKENSVSKQPVLTMKRKNNL